MLQVIQIKNHTNTQRHKQEFYEKNVFIQGVPQKMTVGKKF